MPQERQPQDLGYVNLDDKPFTFEDPEVWTDQYALNTVTQNFSQFENFRSMNHDNRWNNNDALYTGWKEPKVWEGSTIPRASLGRPIVFDNIVSIVPSIYNAIFSIGPEWFQVEAEPGTDPAEARAVQASMSYLLEHSRDNFSTSAKTELKLAFLNMLLYGNGGVELYWDATMMRPCIRWVDIRDFYIDPGCSSPDVEDARAIFRRKMLTVSQIQQLKSAKGFKIPSEEILYALSKATPSAMGDQNKRAQEAYRNVQFQPGSTDYLASPQDRKIEVLIYYSKERIVWVLNRLVVIYNEINPYGFYPFAFAPCYIFPSRFYAMSVGDVQEGNQRYIEALLNGRLDEVSLMLRPPRAMKRGNLLTPSQQKWTPGAVYQVDDPSKDLALLQPQNALQNVYTEIQYLEQQAEKQTGVNAMSQGIPRAGNVNRTATGVNTQVQGANNRLQDLVSNVEDYLIVPMLYKLYKLIQYHTQPGDQLPAMTKYGNFDQVPAQLFQKPLKFRMNAASRMMSKQVMQQMLPFLSQYLLNGQMMGAINGVGKTVDFNEYLQMVQDASGLSRVYNLIRDMTPEEQQQMQQQQEQNPENQKAQADVQVRREAIQAKAQTDHEKNQVELQKAQMSKGDPQIEQMKMQMEQQKMAFEMQLKQKEMENEMLIEQMKAQTKLQAEAQMNQIKAEAQKQSNFMDLQKKQGDLAMKQQDNVMKLKSMALQHQQEMQMGQEQMGLERQKAEMGLQQSEMEHAISMKQQQESHKMGLEHSKREGEQKLKLQKAQSSLKDKHPGYGRLKAQGKAKKK